MTISQERIDKGIQLRQWTIQDEDVRKIVATVCSSHHCGSFAELAEDYPATFDELWETVRDLLDESPSIGNLPGFLQ